MPLCICGKKVIGRTPKITCTTCNNNFHPTCIDARVEDVDLLCRSYKCQSCLKLRRNSLNSLIEISLNSPSNEVRPDALVASDSAVAAEPVSDVVPAMLIDDHSAAVLDDAHVDVDAGAVAAVPATTVDAAVVAVEVAADVPVVDRAVTRSDSNVDVVTIESLRDELVTFRAENRTLVSQVDTLTNKLDEVLAIVRCLQPRNLEDTTTSPKRKKRNIKNKNNVRSTADILVPAVSNDPAVKHHNMRKLPIEGANRMLPAGVVVSANTPVGNYAAAANPLSFANVARAGNFTPIVKTVNKTVVPSVAGTSDNTDLGVVQRLKWVHLSSFKNSVSTGDILNYVKKHAGIAEEYLVCHKLVKKDANVNEMRFVNFKLGVSSDHYDKVFCASLWPANIRVRPFSFLEKGRVQVVT